MLMLGEEESDHVTLYTRDQRIDLARRYYADNAIVQHTWRREEDARTWVCLLAAFGSDMHGSYDCPDDLMPQWLAHVIPSLADGIASSQLSWFAGAVIDRAARWQVLSTASWNDIHMTFLAANIHIFIDATSKIYVSAPPYWQAVVDAGAQAMHALCNRGDIAAARKTADAAADAAEKNTAVRAAANAVVLSLDAAFSVDDMGYTIGPPDIRTGDARSAVWTYLAETLVERIDAALAQHTR